VSSFSRRQTSLHQLRFISPDAARHLVWRHHDLLDVELDSYTIAVPVWTAQSPELTLI